MIATTTDRRGVRRILTNIGWLGLERLIRSATALLVTVWIARHLGPGDFGQLNIAQAVVAAAMPIASYGLSGILVRDLVREPGTRDELLSAALLLRVCGIGLASVVTLVYARFFAQVQSEQTTLILILSTSFLSLLADTVECDYQARLQNGYLVAIKTGFFGVSTILKIILLLNKSSVLAFAWVMASESLLIALGLWVLARVQHRGFTLRPSRVMLMRLLRQGWLFFWVAILGSVYRRLDQLMLGYLSDPQQVGVYSAAWKLLEAISYGPYLAMTALAPALAAAHRDSPAAFRTNFMQATRWLFWPLAGISLLGMLAARLLIPLGFGQHYEAAIRLFEVLVWVLPVYALHLLGIQWATNEHRAGYLVGQGV
ncbi:MAG: flippase, partial [Methylococcus sp.]